MHPFQLLGHSGFMHLVQCGRYNILVKRGYVHISAKTGGYFGFPLSSFTSIYQSAVTLSIVCCNVHATMWFTTSHLHVCVV